MNVLESVLCTSNAEEYTNHFKNYGIDAHTLKLLTDDDLKILGITEEEKRASIIKHAANLQIPAEKQIEILIDKKYMESVLLQMSAQLMRHLAALSIAVNRKDIVICNVKLSPAANCLRYCVSSLDKQLNEFEEKMTKLKRRNRRTRNKIIFSTIFTVSVLFTSYKVYQFAFK